MTPEAGRAAHSAGPSGLGRPRRRWGGVGGSTMLNRVTRPSTAPALGWVSQTHFLSPLPGPATGPSCSGGQGGVQSQRLMGVAWRPARPLPWPPQRRLCRQPPWTVPASPQSCSDPARLEDPTAHSPSHLQSLLSHGSLLRISV